MSRPPRTDDDLSSQSPQQGQGRPATAGDNPATWCVLLPLPLGDGYDYRLPEGLAVAPGDFVVVPLGKREAVGVVWRPGGGQIAAERLKDIAARLDAPRLGEIQRRFIDWVAEYTVSPPGAVLRMAMSVPEALLPPRSQALYRVAEPPPEIKLTPARKRAMDFARTAPAMPLNDLAREAGVGTGVIKGLAEAGALQIVHRAVEPALVQPDWREPGPDLSPAQAQAAGELRARAAAAVFSVTLLDGVPGAGKTEVYFEAIAAALQRGKQVLVLLPEIALSAQWLRRFAQRFGAAPAEWHSDLRGLARRRTWRAVAEGKARVVVGARSALFLPFADLGLIVIDEEHDQAFKQDDGTIYNARDMAVVRARLGGFAAILVSATPSLESVVNVESGRYRLVHLPDRHAGATLPKVELVDLRRDPPARGRFLSPKLAAAMAHTLAQGEQTLLFLNRRGYAPLTLCRSCGHRLQCPNCTAWLVEHRVQHRLLCHHCGHTAPLPQHCPQCSAEHSFVACGPGVERLAEEVSAAHPTARVAVLTSDTLIGPLAAQAAIERIAAGEVDIVIGTQIVAKGHHFPGLTLVGVVDGDIGLSGGDLRAAERTYQLLYQVAGRAGRADKPGRMLLQTHLPEHPVMQALADFDRDRFLAAEKTERAAAHLPPFGRLAALIVSGPDAGRVDAAARALAQAAPRFEDVRVLGPAPAPLALLRGRHRRRLLLKAEREVNVPAVVRAWVDAVKVPSNVRVQIDIDPYGFN